MPKTTFFAPDRLLTLMLRFGGGVMLLAFPMALLPTEWMAMSHESLGLGPFPEPRGPLVEYLARSVSLFYGFHGGLLLVVSTDIHRFRPIVRYLGFMNILFGMGVYAIDRVVGMPILWATGEGVTVAITGMLFLGLLRRIDESELRA